MPLVAVLRGTLGCGVISVEDWGSTIVAPDSVILALHGFHFRVEGEDFARRWARESTVYRGACAGAAKLARGLRFGHKLSLRMWTSNANVVRPAIETLGLPLRADERGCITAHAKE